MPSRPAIIAAGIDVGTNSALLTVARPGPRGLHVLEERVVITRLGQGLRQRGRLSPEAMDRTVAVLEEYGRAVTAFGARARAAGTSALRRADNRDELLERAREALGFPLEVLSGDDEARLGYRGALIGLPGIAEGDRPLVIDPGGGSTEVFVRPDQVVSLEVGAVRLTERFLEHDPPAAGELEACAGRVRDEAAGLDPAGDRTVVGLGGTVTTLAAVAAGLASYDSDQVHGRKLGLDEIREQRRRLAALTVVERERIPCLPPGRADVIVAGAVLLEGLLERLGAGRVLVSDRGLRYGLIAEILDSLE